MARCTSGPPMGLTASSCGRATADGRARAAEGHRPWSGAFVPNSIASSTARSLLRRRWRPRLELWKSDGTQRRHDDAGRSQSRTARAPTREDFTEVNGTVFFRAVARAHGGQLWRTDGATPAPCFCDVLGILSGLEARRPRRRLVFFADDGAVGGELWAATERAEGTVLLRTSCPAPAAPFPPSSPPERTAVLPGRRLALADRWHRGRHGAGCRGRPFR